MSVVPFLPGTDFDATVEDVRAYKLLEIATRMQNRAMCEMDAEDYEAMIYDAADVGALCLPLVR